jgi:hypothetical protein
MNSALYNIDKKECLGDVLSKINTNFQTLETLACNLRTKAQIFENNQSKFKQLSAFIDYNANYIANNYNDYNIVYNTIQKLYTYWLGHQFTVVVPLHAFAPNISNIAELIRVSVLNTNYSPKNYSNYTIVNVINTNFNKRPKSYNIQTFNKIEEVVEVKELSHTIYRYISVDNVWQYFETISCEDPACLDRSITCLPFIQQENKTAALTLSITNIQKIDGLTVVDVNASLFDTTQNNDLVSFTDKDFLAWDWYINNSTSLYPHITAINSTADANINGVANLAENVSDIRLYIKPLEYDTVPALSSLFITAYHYAETNTYTASISTTIVDVPSESKFNVNFDIYESDVKIGDSSLKTITRDLFFRSYVFTPSVYTYPPTTNYNITWIVDEKNTQQIYNTESLNAIIGGREGLTTVTCSVCAYSLAWGDYYTLKKSIAFYNTNLPAALSFKIFPKYAYTPNLIQLNDINYNTIVSAPTAYKGKVSQEEEFIAIADEGYSIYDWAVGDTIISSSSNITTLKIPYSAGLVSSTGAVVSLTAYNEKFPKENNTIYYNTPDGTFSYPITATTSFNNTSFYQNPRVVDYTAPDFSYEVNNTEFDLANKINKVTVNQIIRPKINTPFEILEGEVTYSLVSEYWTAQKTVTATSGSFELFCLNVGDPTVPLCVDSSLLTTLSLSATANVIINISDPTNIHTPLTATVSYPISEEILDNNLITVTPSTLYEEESVIQTINPCGVTLKSSGVGRFSYTIDINDSTGMRMFKYNSYNKPNRFVVEIDGVIVADTGYVGDISYNSELLSLSLGKIVGSSRGKISFVKSSNTNYAVVTVYAPLPNNKWEFNIECFDITNPGQPPIPSSTPTNLFDCRIVPSPTPTPSGTSSSIVLNCSTGPIFQAGQGFYAYNISVAPYSKGTAYIRYNTYLVPDRLTLVNGSKAISTGFVGDEMYNPALTSIGYAPVTGGSVGEIPFNISQDAILYIEAPLQDTAFTINLICPTPTPTVTTTPTQTPSITRTPNTTPQNTPTRTPPKTPTNTKTPPKTPTATVTPSFTNTPTLTKTTTPTPTMPDEFEIILSFAWPDYESNREDIQYRECLANTNDLWHNDAVKCAGNDRCWPDCNVFWSDSIEINIVPGLMFNGNTDIEREMQSITGAPTYERVIQRKDVGFSHSNVLERIVSGSSHQISGNGMAVNYNSGYASRWNLVRKIYESYGWNIPLYTLTDWKFCNPALTNSLHNKDVNRHKLAYVFSAARMLQFKNSIPSTLQYTADNKIKVYFFGFKAVGDWKNSVLTPVDVEIKITVIQNTTGRTNTIETSSGKVEVYQRTPAGLDVVNIKDPAKNRAFNSNLISLVYSYEINLDLAYLKSLF